MQNHHTLTRRQFAVLSGSSLMALAGCETMPPPDPAPAAPPAAFAPTPDELEAFITEEIGARRVAGLSASLVKDGQLMWARGFGLADVANDRPMTPDTIQNIASISKTVTATAVMQLWEQERLGLDDDVIDHLPFPLRNPNHLASPITVRQLLTHTSSLADGPAYGLGYTCGDPTVPLPTWIEEYATPGGRFYSQDNFHDGAPGAIRAYCNVGFGVLGLLVQTVTGQDFAAYCRERIFAPLGMVNTGWYLRDINQANHAVPYRYVIPNMPFDEQDRRIIEKLPDDSGFAGYCLYSFPNYPDGLVRTSVRDFAAFMMAYLNGGAYAGQRILQSTTIDELLRVQDLGPNLQNNTQGLAWVRREDAQQREIWIHDGGDPGVTTHCAIRPADGVGAAIFCNTDTGPLPVEVSRRILEVADGLA